MSEKSYFSFGEGDAGRLSRKVMMLQGTVNAIVMALWLAVFGVIFTDAVAPGDQGKVWLVFGGATVLWGAIAVVGSLLKKHDLFVLSVVLLAVAMVFEVVTLFAGSDTVNGWLGAINLVITAVTVWMLVQDRREDRKKAEAAAVETPVS